MRSFDYSVSPAKFHIIPKIHKNPMVGRPIAVSHSYITRPISIFIDELDEKVMTDLHRLQFVAFMVASHTRLVVIF